MNSFDTTLLLIETEIVKDAHNQERVVDRWSRPVMAIQESLSNFMYFSNRMAGNKLDGVYLIHPAEYQGEKIAEIDGTRYTIKRSRPVVKNNLRLMELTVGEDDGTRKKA